MDSAYSFHSAAWAAGSSVKKRDGAKETATGTASPTIPALYEYGNEPTPLTYPGHHATRFSAQSPPSFDPSPAVASPQRAELSPSPEDSAAAAMCSVWVSPGSPPEVQQLIISWLCSRMAPGPPPELVSRAAALNTATGRSNWQDWLTGVAPEASRTHLVNWLLGVEGSAAALPPSAGLSPGTCGTAPSAVNAFRSSASSCFGSPERARDQDQTLPYQPNSDAFDLGRPSPTCNISPISHRSVSVSDRFGYPLQSPEASEAPSPVSADMTRTRLGALLDEPYSPMFRSAAAPRVPLPVHRSSPVRSAAHATGSEALMLGPIVGGPVVPASYISTELESQLAAALLPPAGDPHEPRFVGLWGPVGSGKTQQAGAAVRSPAVRRVFSGGICWIGVSALSRATPGDDMMAVYKMLAVTVNELPHCQPDWPPLKLIQKSDVVAEELRSWLAVRVANLPGQVLIVLDGVSSEHQMQGLSALGCSLLIISSSRAPLGALAGSARHTAMSRQATVAPMALRCKEFRASGLDDRQAVSLLLVASGCRPDYGMQEAALQVVELSGRLPAELLLLGGIVRKRPECHGLPCRSRDLEVLAQQMQARPDVKGPSACLIRSFLMAIHELHPLDHMMYLRLGVATAEESFSLGLLHALWGSQGGLDGSDVVLLVGRLEQRHLLQRQGDFLADTWHMHDFLLTCLSSELHKDPKAWSAAEDSYLSYKDLRASQTRVSPERTAVGDTPAGSGGVGTRQTEPSAFGLSHAVPNVVSTNTGANEAVPPKMDAKWTDNNGSSSVTLRPTLAPQQAHDPPKTVMDSTKRTPTSMCNTFPLHRSALKKVETPNGASGSAADAVQGRTCSESAAGADNPDSKQRRLPPRQNSRVLFSPSNMSMESRASAASAVTYSDKGKLLGVMESTLRSVAGEASVSMLPPGPDDLEVAAGEEVHYHYHYHPSSDAASPAFTPNSTFGGVSPRKSLTHTAQALSNSLRREGSLSGQLFHADVVDEINDGTEQLASACATAGDLLREAFSDSESNSSCEPSADDESSSDDDAPCGPSAIVQRMMTLHITPFMPMWDKGSDLSHEKAVSDVTRNQVFDYVDGVMIEPTQLPQPKWD